LLEKYPGVLGCFESLLLMPTNVNYFKNKKKKKVFPNQISTTKKVICKNKREIGELH